MKNSFTIWATFLAAFCVVGLIAYGLVRSGHTGVLPDGNGLFAGMTNLAASSVSGDGALPVAPDAQTIPAGYVEYQNAQYGFSLFYPGTLTKLDYDEGGGAHTFVFQNTKDALGFQIFVVPYTAAQVTGDRFRKDEPSGVRQDLVDTTIDGAVAAVFYGESITLGPTREVWFIKSGYLFEVTAPKADDAWLMRIMATWRFL